MANWKLFIQNVSVNSFLCIFLFSSNHHGLERERGTINKFSCIWDFYWFEIVIGCTYQMIGAVCNVHFARSIKRYLKYFSALKPGRTRDEQKKINKRNNLDWNVARFGIFIHETILKRKMIHAMSIEYWTQACSVFFYRLSESSVKPNEFHKHFDWVCIISFAIELHSSSFSSFFFCFCFCCFGR